MSEREPTVDGQLVLEQLPAPRNVGFSSPPIAFLQWCGRQLIALFMIPVGVALGVLGIVEDLWRRRSAKRSG